MPSNLNIQVELKQRKIRWFLFSLVAKSFGLYSDTTHSTWGFLKPVLINVANAGWRPIRFDEWAEFEQKTR